MRSARFDLTEARRLAHRRMNWLGGILLCLMALMGLRAADLALRPIPEAGRAVADARPQHRAAIIDRQGVPLAVSLRVNGLYANPKHIRNPDRVAADLARLWPDSDADALRARLSRDAGFVWIRRHVTPETMQRINEMGHPGLNFIESQRRFYPQGRLAAHLIGYTDIDGQGLAGLERAADTRLQDSSQGPVQTTLDLRFQGILRSALLDAMRKHAAQGAAGIVLDAENGAVRAMVSLPDFDPNHPGAAPPEAIFNRASHGVYELGSVFKLFSTAALLDSAESTTMASRFDAREPIDRHGFTIADFHAEERFLSLPEVFIYSSNIGSALMGERMGGDVLRAYYRDFGLMTSLPGDTGLAARGNPLIPSPWRPINTLTAAYGHGLAVTPLHVAGAAASIVNGGRRITPAVLQDAMRKDAPALQVLKPGVARTINALLRLTVSHGTGANAEAEGLVVGGKTGTAEKPGASGYDGKRLISSFLGVFPMDDPKYVIMMMLDEPVGTPDTLGYATGGWVAAPAVREVISRLAALEGVKPRAGAPPKMQARMQDMLVHIRKEKEKEGSRLAAY